MKVMLVLPKTIGDVILIHNLVDGIVQKYGEEVDIIVYVNEMYKEIIEGNPHITTIKSVPDYMIGWDEIIDDMTTGNYDDVMVPAQLHKEDNIWHQLDHQRHQHLLSFYLDRCRLPKLDNPKLKMFVDKEEFAPTFDDCVVVHTTTLAHGKNWDAFPILVRELILAGYVVVQVGGPKDALAYNEDNDKGLFFNLLGKLSFKEVYALCKQAKGFIGLDSGLSHIAAAAGIQTIVLQGATVPETSGPWGDNVINIVSKTLPQCEKIRCHGNCLFPKEANGKCISNITVDAVMEVVNKTLEVTI